MGCKDRGCKVPGCEVEEIAALGLCMRHYMQQRRGKLGSTRPISPPGEGDSVTVAIDATTKAALIKIGAKSDRSLGELIRSAVAEVYGQQIERMAK